MSDPSLEQTTEVATGFGVSLSAFLWLLTLRVPQETLPRLGFVSALLCVGVALAYCWSVPFAFVVRKRRWSAPTCNIAGLVFMVPGLFLAWSFGHLWAIGLLLVSLGSIASYITRKLAYPKLTPEQIYAPQPPLTLFPN